jgi:hypothetical protein
MCGATTGQKQSAGHEYECDAFFHGVFLVFCLMCDFGLTKKAEPPPTRGVNRDSGTDRANGGWLRRLVRHQRREIHNKSGKSKRSPIGKLPHLLAVQTSAS